MIDKRTFSHLMNSLGSYVSGLENLETALNIMFDNNFLTTHIDRTLVTLSESFFTQEQLDNIEDQVAIETVTDMIYHYAFKGEFGLKTAELQRLYVEDEGLATEFSMNAFTSEELYDVIERYLHPPKECETFTIHC